MTNFFTSHKTIDELLNAKKAYAQAKKLGASGNPDLSYNLATIHSFLQEY